MLKELHHRILINLKLLQQQGRTECTSHCLVNKNYHSHVNPWPELRKINEAIEELKLEGLLYTKNYLELTTEGSKQAVLALEGFFAKTMIQSFQSQTLQRFRKDLYGIDLYQYNITTRQQFDTLKNFIQPSENQRLLDLGCGLGGTSEYFAQFGAHVHGIDLSRDLIAFNQKRARLKPELKLSFESANLCTYAPPAETFDRIYSIDTFQFLPFPDLKRILPELFNSLKIGGKMAILYSQPTPSSQESGKPHLVGPHELGLGRALDQLHIPYTSIDFSDEYLSFWRRSAQIAESHQAAFAQEGLIWFYRERLQESARILKETLSGKSAFGRYLYLIRR